MVNNFQKINITYTNEMECILIPMNDPILILCAKILLPLCLLLFIIKVYLSKSLNKYVINLSNHLKIIRDERPYLEIYINLIFIWLICGQMMAGLCSLLYSKSDQAFIEAISNLKIDELSVYMTRFAIDEIFALPIRYMIWEHLWEKTTNIFNISQNSYFKYNNSLNYYYIFIKGVTWSINIWISLSLVAMFIATINYTLLEKSPFVITARFIYDLEYSCREKFIITLLIRMIFDYLQIYLSNYVLSNSSDFINNLKLKIKILCSSKYEYSSNYEKFQDNLSA